MEEKGKESGGEGKGERKRWMWVEKSNYNEQ